MEAESAQPPQPEVVVETAATGQGLERAASQSKLTAAMVFGIVGGCLGLLVGLFALLSGGIAMGLDVEGAQGVFDDLGMAGRVAAILGMAGMLAATVGISGAALARSQPELAALLLLGSGVAGFVLLTPWLVAGPFLLIGSLLAYSERARLAESTATRDGALRNVGIALAVAGAVGLLFALGLMLGRLS